MNYFVIHTDGKSVECVLQTEDLVSALEKAWEIAVRSGFFVPETVDGFTAEEAMENGRLSLWQDHLLDGEGPRCDQRVSVKRAWVASPVGRGRGWHATA